MAAISALQEKFSEIGKDAKFDGSTVQLQKEYDKLSAKLDNLAEKEKRRWLPVVHLLVKALL